MSDYEFSRLELVADYGHVGDLAFAEVEQKLVGLLPPTLQRIRSHSVAPFDTTETGFYLAQLAMNSKLNSTQLFYVNTAPRKDDVNPRKNAAGEGLVYAKLFNGVEIVAVNSGYSLSFIKEGAEKICRIDVANYGSQFRSRDIFPEAVAKIARRDYSLVREDIKSSIPDMPMNVLAYTDGYGNIKTSIETSSITSLAGSMVRISVNNITRKAIAADGIFAVKEGDLTFAPGSSGWTLPNGKTYSFVEIVLRGGSASELFNRPKGGDKIFWDKAA